MHFKIVFDFANEGYTGWPILGIGIIVSVVNLLLVLAPNKTIEIPLLGPVGRRRLYLSGAAFMALWSISFAGVTLVQYARYRDALTSGRVHTTEGVVTDFQQRKNVANLNSDIFWVSGTRFVVTEASIFGYQRTKARGSPIGDGIHVRIAHEGNAILRLEIAQ